ncbi:MAG TPA: hypothetical protein VEU08_19335 [Vicinamibacterales bacterium]|nr:hypothetical protein [Vicinamibacterales bacterium]
MRKTIAAIAVLTLSTVSQTGAADSDPRVTFTYSPLFDPACYTAIKQPIDQPMIDTARMHQDEWKAEWDREAPALFSTTVKVTGLPFGFHETIATVVTCPAFISMSSPLLLNVRQLLDRTKQGIAMKNEFSQMLFHEVLHRYINERIRALGGTTPSWEKYKAEPQPVRSHIYVEAIMELVYRTLGREEEGAAIRQRDAGRGAVAGGLRGATDMARALEIVEKEGAATLVRELSPK